MIDPDTTYDESTNPSNGWRAPDGAYAVPRPDSTVDEIVAWLEQEPGADAESALLEINAGYPAGEVLTAYLDSWRGTGRFES